LKKEILFSKKNNMKKALSIQVFGLVQGVWFRKSTQEKAIELGIAGFVKNENDGSVYIEAEGSENHLKIFVDWCHIGPSGANVSKVMSKQASMQNHVHFVIKK